MYHVELASFPQWVQTSVLDVQRQNPTVMKVMIPVDVAIATSHFLLLSFPKNNFKSLEGHLPNWEIPPHFVPKGSVNEILIVGKKIKKREKMLYSTKSGITQTSICAILKSSFMDDVQI